MTLFIYVNDCNVFYLIYLFLNKFIIESITFKHKMIFLFELDHGQKTLLLNGLAFV